MVLQQHNIHINFIGIGLAILRLKHTFRYELPYMNIEQRKNNHKQQYLYSIQLDEIRIYITHQCWYEQYAIDNTSAISKIYMHFFLDEGAKMCASRSRKYKMCIR
jgi:hypothetical protein